MIDKILPGQPLIPGKQTEQVRPLTPRTPGAPTAVPETTTSDVSFRQLLDETLRTQGGVKFSAHALKRLASRGIELAPADVEAVEAAVGQAADKGARDSLVFAEEYALVVNIPSRTVITAFDQQGLRENVVTNIDSAVFVSRT